MVFHLFFAENDFVETSRFKEIKWAQKFRSFELCSVALFPCSSIGLIEFSAGVQGIIALFQVFLFLLVSLKIKQWAQKYCTIGLIEF